jgi:hypothetical protein
MTVRLRDEEIDIAASIVNVSGVLGHSCTEECVVRRSTPTHGQASCHACCMVQRRSMSHACLGIPEKGPTELAFWRRRAVGTSAFIMRCGLGPA